MRHYNLAQGLDIHNSFVNLDLISRSQVCQNYTLQSVFKFVYCNLMVRGCYMGTRYKDQAQYALCDWCVFKR